MKLKLDEFGIGKKEHNKKKLINILMNKIALLNEIL